MQKLNEKNKKLQIETWGREITLNNSVFPHSIKSQEKEILSSPIRIKGLSNNEPIEWIDEGCFYLADVKDQIIINGYAKAQNIILNTSYQVDESGTLTMDVKISPMGLTENQVFGVEEKPDLTRTIQQIYLEFPIKKEFNIFNFSRFANNKVFNLKGESIYQTGIISKDGVRAGFQALTSLSDGEVGLTVSCESQRNWTIVDEDDAIEIIETENEYILRYKLINKNPKSWNDDSLIWSPQLCYRFFLTPTPTKPINKELLMDKIVHLGCFEHIKNEQDYYSFLEEKYNEEETNFDHIVKSGAKWLILHERWNTIQCYWHYDKYTMDSLKNLVKKCHKNKIKVMVYFGFEVTSISHDFLDAQIPVTNYPRENVLLCDWYREPYQRATPLCFGEEKRRKEYIEGVFKTVKLFNLDGVYFDGTATPRPCCNINHGCGVRDEEGKLHPTFPITAVRDTMKEICAELHKMGKRVDIHSSGLLVPSIIHYADSIWEGENLQTVARDTEDKRFILSALRASQLGPNVQFIAFNLREDWGIKQAQALCLPCGIYTRANSIYKPLDVVKPIWDIITNYNISKAQFVGYWKNDLFATDNENILVSYYINDKNKYLVYASNPTRKEIVVTIEKKDTKEAKNITLKPLEIIILKY